MAIMQKISQLPTLPAASVSVVNDGLIIYNAAGNAEYLVSPTELLNAVGASLAVYANNAAAITGGLAAGNLYRTGADPDVVCVVH